MNQQSFSSLAKAIGGAVAVVALSGTAHAALTVYSGYDEGSSVIGPLSSGAASAFDAAVGAHSTITFESGIPAGVAISGGSITNSFGCAPNLCGFNTTVAGSLAYSLFGGAATFTFSSPIDSFGAYFTGVQLANTIVFNDGAAQVVNIPGVLADGGIAFVGFTDFGSSFTSLTVNVTTSQGGDIIAIDDVRLATGGTPPIPEPETYALMLAGLGALGMVARRRQTKI